MKAAGPEDKGIKIDFQDTGEGISAENAKKIFNPFTTKDHGSGFGSLVRALLKVIRGTLPLTVIFGQGPE